MNTLYLIEQSVKFIYPRKIIVFEYFLFFFYFKSLFCMISNAKRMRITAMNTRITSEYENKAKKHCIHDAFNYMHIVLYNICMVHNLYI